MRTQTLRWMFPLAEEVQCHPVVAKKAEGRCRDAVGAILATLEARREGEPA